MNRTRYMTLPQSTPPTHNNSWICLINRPQWIAHLELIQLTFQLLQVLCAHHILQQGPPPLTMRMKKHLLFLLLILPPAAFLQSPSTPERGEEVHHPGLDPSSCCEECLGAETCCCSLLQSECGEWRVCDLGCWPTTNCICIPEPGQSIFGC